MVLFQFTNDTAPNDGINVIETSGEKTAPRELII